jgi:NAD(P)-dependent dehydrogenase (short-subunit alcohol dehydrogenase family)
MSKVFLLTGSTRGLGRQIAEATLAAGHRLVATARRPEALADLAERYGRQILPVELDVTDPDAAKAAVAAGVEAFGRLDVVVNNAGISRIGPHTQDVTDQDWNDSIAVLQTGVFFGMRAAGRIMLEQGSGAIINISSIRGFSPNPGRMAYCAAKAAVIMMTSIAAGEWASRGIRVNAIAPGVMRTPMWDSDVAAGIIDEEAYLELVPAKRLGIPADVGRLAVYLASDAAAYVNGSCIAIDGALTSIPAG